MNVRAQVSMVFHLDKCIGCHTCSIACKNVWTDRKGTEYMWWNNVETKPGTGYPTLWEDQDRYRGGWQRKPKDEAERISGKPRSINTDMATCRCPRTAMACAVSAQMRSGSNGKGPLCSL